MVCRAERELGGGNELEHRGKSEWSPSMILVPGRNVWRVAKARRAAVLLDGAEYFAALRSAMIKARHSIVIAGWDIHSQMQLR